MFTATVRPISRAISRARMFSFGVTRLRWSRSALPSSASTPEEHVVQAEPPPVLEHLAVLDQHVAAGLQVVLLADAAALDLAADGEAVLGLDERDVVDEEHVGLADPREVLGRRLRRELAVAPAVERPRAAERAVPRTAAGELGRRAGIEHADEVLPAPPREVAGGQVIVEVWSRVGRGPAPWRVTTPGSALEPVVAEPASSTRGAMPSASPRTTQSSARARGRGAPARRTTRCGRPRRRSSAAGAGASPWRGRAPRARWRGSSAEKPTASGAKSSTPRSSRRAGRSAGPGAAPRGRRPASPRPALEPEGLEAQMNSEYIRALGWTRRTSHSVHPT